MKTLSCAIAVLACAAASALPAVAAEATFERTLTLSGRPDLTISTGAGAIHLTAGPEGRIHILGHLRSAWGGSDQEVRDLAAHPPIEQTGNIVRIGAHPRGAQNVVIDYEIEAPASAFLNAATGAGNLTIEGVGPTPGWPPARDRFMPPACAAAFPSRPAPGMSTRNRSARAT